ncbi:MAG: ABC transporter ATP-binding protein [Thermoleophilia bacterium]|nr:ABC transporter ATP-binding protein [Thermoleophilia bacterium]
MANVRIRSLTKRFGGKTPTTAIDDLDLAIEEGEFLVLLGPSGCGKTTTLRCIAGLETAEEGAISFGERAVFDASRSINVPPNKRNIGMVFQSYALWPHMTVRKNIGYPLRTRRVKRDQAAQWIDDVAALVDTTPLLDRYPAQLSGGQQQRIALARGLVARPELVLFDEPLSNLDARLRDQVRTEIHELHGRLGFTAVYVTHDQVEALALGDRLAIMRSGALEQLAPPDVIFEEPATEYVAGFIGMGNRLVFERHDGAWWLDGERVDGDLDGIAAGSTTVVARTRPEDLDLLEPGRDGAGPGALAFPVTVLDAAFGGRHLDVAVTTGTTRLLGRIDAGERGGWPRTLERERHAVATVKPRDLAFYDGDDRLVSGVGRAVGAGV